jgi:hypothetical protein
MRASAVYYLWYYLWIAPHCLQVLVVAAMVRRRLYREFPYFLLYTGYEVLQNTVLFVLGRLFPISSPQYLGPLWVGLVGSVILRFAVIYEIFRNVFTPYPALTKLSRGVFRWAAAGLILVAVAVAAYVPGDSSQRLLSGLNVADRTVSMVQCGLLVLILLFSSYFRLTWQSPAFGIALGLGVFASVELAASALRAQIAARVPSYVGDLVTMGTYHICVLVWLVYVLVPEPVRAAVPAVPIDDLESWRQEFQRLLHR